jgi:hypothetical protein
LGEEGLQEGIGVAARRARLQDDVADERADEVRGAGEGR